MKRTLSILLVIAMMLCLVACGGKQPAAQGDAPTQGAAAPTQAAGPAEAPAKELKKVTIGVALYTDVGPAPNSVKAFLAAVGPKLNADFKYVVLSQSDEAASLTKIQELISAGVDGIICTQDTSMPTVLEECRNAGVYLAGYLCDYDKSFTTDYDTVFKHPNFLGTVADGQCSDEVVTGKDYFDTLIEYNKNHPDAPVLNVSMCTFPTFAFPQHQAYVKQFVECVDEYNKTAADGAKITVQPLDPDVDILMFKPMDTTYFQKHAGIDAIISFCAGRFAYGAMVTANVANDLKLFAAGYEEGDCDNFGTKGTGTYQQEIVCASESVVYPLVLLINKLNGLSFPDQPEVSERRSASRLIINSDEDMEAFKNSLYLTYNAENALFTPDDVYNMTAANPNATYAALVEALAHMTIDDVAANAK